MLDGVHTIWFNGPTVYVLLRFPSCLFILRWHPVSAVRQRPDPQWGQRGGHSWVRTHQQRQQSPLLTHTPPPRHPGGRGGQPLQTGEGVIQKSCEPNMDGWVDSLLNSEEWEMHSIDLGVCAVVFLSLWGPIWVRFLEVWKVKTFLEKPGHIWKVPAFLKLSTIFGKWWHFLSRHFFEGLFEG